MKILDLRINTFSLFFLLLIFSCNKVETYTLANTKIKGSYYKITHKKDKLLIQEFSNNKLFFDYDLKRTGDNYFFSETDKLIDERGKLFLSKEEHGRIYSYMIDLDGKPIFDSLLTNKNNEVYSTTIKSIKSGYNNGFLFYYNENFKIDSIKAFGKEIVFIYK